MSPHGYVTANTMRAVPTKPAMATRLTAGLYYSCRRKFDRHMAGATPASVGIQVNVA